MESLHKAAVPTYMPFSFKIYGATGHYERGTEKDTKKHLQNSTRKDSSLQRLTEERVCGFLLNGGNNNTVSGMRHTFEHFMFYIL